MGARWYVVEVRRKDLCWYLIGGSCLHRGNMSDDGRSGLCIADKCPIRSEDKSD